MMLEPSAASLTERWYEAIAARIRAEDGINIDCSIAFRVLAADGVLEEELSVGVKDRRSKLYPGILRPTAIATLTVRRSFFEVVLDGSEDVDIRTTKHVVDLRYNTARLTRWVHLFGQLMNRPTPPRLDALARAKERVATHGVVDEAVQHRFGPSSEDFLRECIERSRPVVLKGAIDEWPAMGWTRERLLERHGEIKLGPLTLNELFSEQPSPGKPRYITGLAPPKGLAKQFGELPFLRGRLASRYVFGGQEGGQTGLHCDFDDGILVQVFGKKTLLFYPPTVTDDVYAMKSFCRSQHCWVDAFAPDLGRHPRFGALRPISVSLVPGDVLSVPMGWFHAAIADEPTFSVGTFLLDGNAANPVGGY
jgi:hypothetical protein